MINETRLQRNWGSRMIPRATAESHRRDKMHEQTPMQSAFDNTTLIKYILLVIESKCAMYFAIYLKRMFHLVKNSY